MSKFSDMMNSQLPSKTNGSVVEESVDETTEVATEGCEEEEGYQEEDTDLNDDGMDDNLDDDVDDLGDDDDNIDDMSEEDLAALDAELSDNAIDDAIGDDNDDEEINLSPDEEVQADDMMKVAATAMLVNDELSVEEKVAFIESKEADIAITEGFMTDSDVNAMSVDCGLVTEGNNYNKKMIIRLDAESKKKQLKALAVNVSAAAHKDPDYYKLKKVMKMRKILRRKLAKKYNAEATKRMKVYFARLRNSKAPTLNKMSAKHN